MSGQGNLIPTVVIDKNGHQRTVYIRPDGKEISPSVRQNLSSLGLSPAGRSQKHHDKSSLVGRARLAAFDGLPPNTEGVVGKNSTPEHNREAFLNEMGLDTGSSQYGDKLSVEFDWNESDLEEGVEVSWQQDGRYLGGDDISEPRDVEVLDLEDRTELGDLEGRLSEIEDRGGRSIKLRVYGRGYQLSDHADDMIDNAYFE